MEKNFICSYQIRSRPWCVYKKVTSDKLYLNIKLGCICVRNKIGAESYEEARIEEAELFETHPLLSKLDKSSVGIQMLANRLTRLQSLIISNSLPKIFDNINQSINNSPPPVTTHYYQCFCCNICIYSSHQIRKKSSSKYINPRCW